MRKIVSKHLENTIDLRDKLIELSKQFPVFSILDSNNWQYDQHKKYDLLAAFGSASQVNSKQNKSSFEQLRAHHQKHNDWLFGYLAYDLKNELEQLQSNKADHINATNMRFFVPQLLILLKGKQLEILVHEDYLSKLDIEKSIHFIFDDYKPKKNKSFEKIEIKHRINRQHYLDAIHHIRQHIKQGDIYELNYCQEFYSENINIEPSEVFRKLIKKSPTPFSVFQCFDDVFLMSASPERFLKKTGQQIISQPIKGTARREADTIKDKQTINALQNDEKERAENIMIVDLVRNDLAHTAKKNSVKVEELCKIYSFEQVHQMISTISSKLDEKFDFVDVLKTTFPMGSMTGAPKIRAMQLIEQYEETKRGIYSGAVGYITPDGDFDFNVVIRSLVYNKSNKYLSFIAGGAITYQSEAEKEYAESLLKAEAIRAVIS
jgi:para-aminobenzoate synthetase component 1